MKKHKTFLLYLLRWQASALVMLPFLWAVGFVCTNEYVNLHIIQFIGALIFWKIDQWIFRPKPEINLNELQYGKSQL